MAAFDRAHGHIVVRVVYDGPAGSGKTENLKQLVHTFTSQRRGELSSPRPRGDSTAYFDWLHLNGGVVAGHALRAQLVTVPGRSVLTRRRWQIVETADVVVFVCDSTRIGVKDARRRLELLRAHLRRAKLSPPIIVQANKQDLPDALPPAEVAQALRLPADAEVVAAAATTGTGLRDTVVRAIRAAAAIAERQTIDPGVDGMPDATDEAELLARLDGSAQLRAALAPRQGTLPAFPDEDAPRGEVWPDTTGRRVLRALARALAATPIASAAAAEGTLALRAGALRLETSPERRFADPAAARAALVEYARGRVRLGALHAPETTLVLAGADDGATWLWTVSPWTATLRERIDAAVASRDGEALSAALRAHARAAVDALLLAARDQTSIDADPACFGLAGARPIYLGGRIGTSGSISQVVDAVTRVARELTTREHALRDYVDAIDAALAEHGALLDDARTAATRSFESFDHMLSQELEWGADAP